MKKKLIKNLLNVFENSDDKTLEGFKAFDIGVSKLKNELREKIQIGTLDEVSDKLETFKKKVDIAPLEEAVVKLHDDFLVEVGNLASQVNEKTKDLVSLVSFLSSSN